VDIYHSAPYSNSNSRSSGASSNSIVLTPLLFIPPRSNGKTRGCYCSCSAPDDGREDARNMLSRT